MASVQPPGQEIPFTSICEITPRVLQSSLFLTLFLLSGQRKTLGQVTALSRKSFIMPCKILCLTYLNLFNILKINCLGLDIRLRMDAEPPGNKQPPSDQMLEEGIETRG